MMNPAQCRMARAALRLTTQQLADMASVGLNTVNRFEQGQPPRQSSVDAMQTCLEAAGVIFLADGEDGGSGGAGVRLRRD